MWRFIKDFFIYGFASVLGKIAAVFLMPIYTNILTQEEYGAMAIITACKGIIDLFSNLNIHSGVARDYCEPGINKKKLFSTGFWSIIVISFFVLTILFITRSFWLNNVLGLGNIYMLPFIVMLFSMPAGSALTYFSVMTRFKRCPKKYSLGVLLQLIVQIGLSIYTVIFIKIGILGIFIGILSGEIVSTFYFYYINRDDVVLTFEYRYLRQALIFAIPTLPAILAGWADSSFGQILIGKYISEAQLGVYSISLQLASIFSLVGVALNNVWGPYLYENYKRPTFIEDVNKLYKSILILLISLAVNISLLSEQIIVLLSNVTYIKAAKYLVLLCIPMSVYLLFPIANSGISISRDTKYTGIAYVLGGIINLIALFILLPLMGVIGAPISLGLSRITTFFYLYHISNKKGFINLHNGLLYLLMISVLLCYFLLSIQLSSFNRIVILSIFNPCIIYYSLKKYKIFQKLKQRFYE